MVAYTMPISRVKESPKLNALHALPGDDFRVIPTRGSLVLPKLGSGMILALSRTLNEIEDGFQLGRGTENLGGGKTWYMPSISDLYPR